MTSAMLGTSIRAYATLIFALVLIVSVQALAADAANIDFDREAGQLAISTPATPVAPLLADIAEEAGFDLVTEGDLGDVVPQDVEGLTLEQGIRRLVDEERVSLLFRYRRDESGEARLVEVRATSRVPGPALEVILEDRKMRALNRHLPPPNIPPPPVPALKN